MRLHRTIPHFFGYDMIRLSKQPTIESHLQILFDHYNINLVLDVGANSGQYAKMLRNKVKYKGRIISFEPVSSVFKQLSENSASDEKWDVFQVALGQAEKTLDINIAASSDYSSFRTPNENATGYRSNETVITSKESVKVVRLDKFLSAHLERINKSDTNIYLKMDTQGYDLDVMHGAEKLHKHIIALQSELSMIPLYENMPTYIESLSTFDSYGFTPSGLYPISRDPDSLRLIEMDCIMINKAL